MTHLRFTPTEFQAMVAASAEHELGKVGLAAFSCLLAFELTETWPELSRKVAQLSDGEIRLLREGMPDHEVRGFTAAELRVVAEAGGPVPLTGRFAKPLRRQVVQWLRPRHRELARRVHRLSYDAFDRLCEKLQELRAGG